MDKIQINKSRMYGSVDLALDNHSKLFADYGELVTAHQKLKDDLVMIGQNRQVQEADITGLTKTKIELKTSLIRKILKISSGLMAYATSVKNLDLKTKAKYTATDLKTSADPILYDIGVLLLGLATPIKTELAKYAIDEADYTEMESLLNGFKLAIPRRRVAASASKMSTGNIGEVFIGTDKLLKDEIDVLMKPFQFSQPDFYNTYKNARSIVDYSGRGKAKPLSAN